MIMKDMLKNISDVTGLNQAQVHSVYNAFIAEIEAECKLENVCKVQIPKLGILNITVKEPYNAKNPRSGETVPVERTRVCRFSLAKSIKNVVKDNFDEKSYLSNSKKKSAPAKKEASESVAKKASAKPAKKAVKKK